MKPSCLLISAILCVGLGLSTCSVSAYNDRALPALGHRFNGYPQEASYLSRHNLKPLLQLYYLIQEISQHHNSHRHDDREFNAFMRDLVDKGLQQRLRHEIHRMHKLEDFSALERHSTIVLHPWEKYSFFNDYRRLLPAIHGALNAVHLRQLHDLVLRVKLNQLKQRADTLTADLIWTELVLVGVLTDRYNKNAVFGNGQDVEQRHEKRPANTGALHTEETVLDVLKEKKNVLQQKVHERRKLILDKLHEKKIQLSESLNHRKDALKNHFGNTRDDLSTIVRDIVGNLNQQKQILTEILQKNNAILNKLLNERKEFVSKIVHKTTAPVVDNINVQQESVSKLVNKVKDPNVNQFHDQVDGVSHVLQMNEETISGIISKTKGIVENALYKKGGNKMPTEVVLPVETSHHGDVHAAEHVEYEHEPYDFKPEYYEQPSERRLDTPEVEYIKELQLAVAETSQALEEPEVKSIASQQTKTEEESAFSREEETDPLWQTGEPDGRVAGEEENDLPSEPRAEEVNQMNEELSTDEASQLEPEAEERTVDHEGPVLDENHQHSEENVEASLPAEESSQLSVYPEKEESEVSQQDKTELIQEAKEERESLPLQEKNIEEQSSYLQENDVEEELQPSHKMETEGESLVYQEENEELLPSQAALSKPIWLTDGPEHREAEDEDDIPLEYWTPEPTKVKAQSVPLWLVAEERSVDQGGLDSGEYHSLSNVDAEEEDSFLKSKFLEMDLDGLYFVSNKILNLVAMLDEGAGFKGMNDEINSDDMALLINRLARSELKKDEADRGITQAEIIDALQWLIKLKDLSEEERMLDALEHWKKAVQPNGNGTYDLSSEKYYLVKQMGELDMGRGNDTDNFNLIPTTTAGYDLEFASSEPAVVSSLSGDLAKTFESNLDVQGMQPYSEEDPDPIASANEPYKKRIKTFPEEDPDRTKSNEPFSEEDPDLVEALKNSAKLEEELEESTVDPYIKRNKTPDRSKLVDPFSGEDSDLVEAIKNSAKLEEELEEPTVEPYIKRNKTFPEDDSGRTKFVEHLPEEDGDLIKAIKSSAKLEEELDDDHGFIEAIKSTAKLDVMPFPEEDPDYTEPVESIVKRVQPFPEELPDETEPLEMA